MRLTLKTPTNPHRKVTFWSLGCPYLLIDEGRYGQIFTCLFHSDDIELANKFGHLLVPIL